MAGVTFRDIVRRVRRGSAGRSRAETAPAEYEVERAFLEDQRAAAQYEARRRAERLVLDEPELAGEVDRLMERPPGDEHLGPLARPGPAEGNLRPLLRRRACVEALLEEIAGRPLAEVLEDALRETERAALAKAAARTYDADYWQYELAHQILSDVLGEWVKIGGLEGQ